MFARFSIIKLVFFLSIFSGQLLTSNEPQVDNVNLNELKNQTVSVLKNRLLELGKNISMYKNNLVSDVDSKELECLEKNYEVVKNKLSDLEHIFNEPMPTGFFNANKMKSLALVLGVTGLTGGLGYLGSRFFDDDPARRYLAYGLAGLLILFEVLAFYFSETIALVFSDAERLDKEKYGYVYKIVEELAAKAGIPTPKVWYNPMGIPNAFACGRNQSNASVLVTRGLLEVLDENEVRAVLAHEISHIKNYDMALTTLANVISTPGLLVSKALRQGATDRSNDNDALVKVACFFIGLFSEVALNLMNLSISRSREYLADESGAKLIADPMALASALNKIRDKMRSKYNNTSNFSAAELSFSKGFEMMCIASPFKENASGDVDAQDDMEVRVGTIRGIIEWFKEWTSTHPLTKNRVAKLKELEKQYIKILEDSEACA